MTSPQSFTKISKLWTVESTKKVYASCNHRRRSWWVQWWTEFMIREQTDGVQFMIREQTDRVHDTWTDGRSSWYVNRRTEFMIRAMYRRIAVDVLIHSRRFWECWWNRHRSSRRRSALRSIPRTRRTTPDLARACHGMTSSAAHAPALRVTHLKRVNSNIWVFRVMVFWLAPT